MIPLRRRVRPGPTSTDARDDALREADRRWSRVLSVDPGCESALLELAGNRLAAGDARGADRHLSRLRAVGDPARPRRRVELEARRAELAGDLDGAQRHWRHHAELCGGGKASSIALARLALERNDAAEAHATLDALDPNVAAVDEQARLLRARAFAITNDWTAAREALGDPCSYALRRGAAVELLVRCCLADRRHDELSQLLDPETIDAVRLADYFRGRLAFAEGRYVEAGEHFERSADAHVHPDSKVWLVRSLAALDRSTSPDDRVERLVAQDPTDHVTAARCWEAAGRLRRSAIAYRQAAIESRAAKDWYALARFHHTHRDWAAAWHAVLDARRHRADSDELRALSVAIVAGFAAVEEPLPRTRRRCRRTDFRSSERMIEAMVTRLVREPPTLRATDPARRRTIALVINSLGPGGAERQVVNLANGLVKRHPEERVVLLCTHLGRTDQDRFYVDQLDPAVELVEYHDRDGEADPGTVPALAPHADLLAHMQPDARRKKIVDLAVALDALDPDIVHGWLDETFINTALVGRALGLPVVAGRWGSMPPGVSRTVTERAENDIAYLESAYRSIARLPGLSLSSNSRLTADAYADLMAVPREAVGIVYNGIDEPALLAQRAESQDPRIELGIGADARVVGTVFRMTEEKRPLLWIDVAARLAEDHPDWHFVIVGAGPMLAEIEARAATASLPNLHLVGKRQNVGAWFHAFDAMLLTSRVEGVSNAVVEAQMCGCPVVAPNVGGLSEAMSDGVSGRLLETDGVEDFVGALESLLEDPSVRDAIGDTARRFARDKFGIDGMIANYRRLFGIEAPSAR